MPDRRCLTTSSPARRPPTGSRSLPEAGGCSPLSPLRVSPCRINRNRVSEALDTGAGILAASCPFCMTMFEDGILGMDAGEQIQVRDIAELVAAAMITPGEEGS